MARALGWMAAILFGADQLLCQGIYTEMAKQLLTQIVAHV